jgi:hypothetical protein
VRRLATAFQNGRFRARRPRWRFEKRRRGYWCPAFAPQENFNQPLAENFNLEYNGKK